MYGRGNFASPVGQGSYTSAPTFQQHPHPPAPPFLQGPPATVQHGSLPVLPHGGQLGRPAYQHTPPVPPQPGQPHLVPLSGIGTQSYLTPPPPPPPLHSLQVHGSSQMQQRSQWSQNTHFVPPTVPSLAPTVLPPPPSQGQTPYGSRGHQPPGGGMQSPPPPHPPASCFFASPPVGFSGHSMPQHSDIPAVGPPPPPLPSSPLGSPPLPPSSPPPTASSPFSRSRLPKSIPAANDSANFPQSGSSVSEGSGFDKSATGYVKEVSAYCLIGGNTCKSDGSWKHDGENGSKMGSPHAENLILDLASPPPKPLDDRIVRNIEILCQSIAKNGPEFEDLTRKRELGNPEFSFLFGGDPGSEDAVSLEYFIWMRNKCQLECKSVGRSDFPVKLLGGSSSQLNIAVNIGIPYSPADSDMDMEDDITHPDEELKLCLTNNLSTETFSMSRDVCPTDQVQLSHSTSESIMGIDGNVTLSRSSGIEEKGQGSETSSHQNQSTVRKPLAQVDGLAVNSFGDVSHEDMSQHNASVDLAESRLEKLPSQLVKRASPFKLVQDYASEGSSDDEACHEDVRPVTVSSFIGSGSTTLNTEAGGNLETGLGPKNPLESAKELEMLPESCKSKDALVKPVNLVMEADMTSASQRSEDFVDNIYQSQDPFTDGLSHGELRLETASRNTITGVTVDKKEDAKAISTNLKVDEFGRLLREGGSDSDSGGSPRYRRQRGKRGRSRSRSRSPHDRRRKSPRRRKERRGRSRSLSPKRRRSRSKSPPYRHGGEYPGEKMRRDKGQLPECFDFLRGKCYRGSSCRYLHRQDKSDRSRSYRSKQQLQDLQPSSRSSDLYEKTILDKKFGHEHGKGNTQELKPLDMTVIKEKKVLNEPTACVPDSGGDLGTSSLHDADTVKLPCDANHVTTCIEKVELQQSKSHYSDQIFRKLDQQNEQTEKSSASETSSIHTSSHAPSLIPIDKSDLNKDSKSQPYTSLNSTNNSTASESIPSQSIARQVPIAPAADHPSSLAASSFPLLSQEVSNQQMPGDYSMISPARKFPLSSASFEQFPPYQASISYSHSQFPFPPNPSWNSLPLPPAQTHPSRPLFVNNVTGPLTYGQQYGGGPVHFQRNMIPPKNDFSASTSVQPYITEFPLPSHLVQNQPYPLLQEPDRPLSHVDDLRPGTYSSNHQISQAHGGPGLVGQDHFAARPLRGLYPSSSYGQKNLHSQAMPVSKESPPKSLQAFHGENLPPGELSTPSYINHSYLQQPSYGLPCSAADGVSSLLGEDGKISSTLSRYTPDLLDQNQQSLLSDFSGSRIPNHFNPYASTFEQPLSSKFSSAKFDAAYGLSHASVDGTVTGSHGSRNMISTQNSAQAIGAILPRSGDQYDPLYDSLEPSSNSTRKSVSKREETDESDVMLRLSGPNNSLDVEGNKQKGDGSIALSASLDNEEYGETADAEVGAVENGSPSNLNDAIDIAAGDFEIDQVKAPRKSKSKDSRSMKLFKVALAGFVKEVLKSSWRQGNMSKEAFKTIVKKTVDKVSGAMKSQHVPKSQAKINHYIDSSQRKLTKLVMGYVDKYVKA